MDYVPSYVPIPSEYVEEKVDYESLLKRALPYVLKEAQSGSHDAEILQVEIEQALK
jgi:hypothetical protein